MNETMGNKMVEKDDTPCQAWSRLRNPIILAGIIVMFVIAGLCIFVLFEPSAETALKRYVRTDFTYDYRDFSRYCAYNVETLTNEMYKTSGLSADDRKKAIITQSELAAIELKEIYGVGYKINVEITNIKEFDDTLLEKSIAGMISTFEYLGYDITKVINTDKINKMIDFEYEITIDGNLGISTHQGSMLMARVGRRWGALPSLFW